MAKPIASVRCLEGILKQAAYNPLVLSFIASRYTSLGTCYWGGHIAVEVL